MVTTWVRPKKGAKLKRVSSDAPRQVAEQRSVWRDSRDGSMVGPGATVTLAVAVDGLDCAPAGKQGHLSRCQNGEATIVLPCGHVVCLLNEEILEVREGTYVPASEEKEAEEKQMAKSKKAVIPNSKGVIPVQGLEAEVKKYKTAYMFFKQLETDVEEQKVQFRQLAQQTADGATSMPDRVEFMAEDGSCVPVSFPDINKDGNRTSVSDKAISEVLQLGVDPTAEAGMFEIETKVVLSGAWVDWFRQALTAQFGEGAAMPDGVEEKVVRKLTVEGIVRLKQLMKDGATENERKAAETLFKAGTKSPSVGVR